MKVKDRERERERVKDKEKRRGQLEGGRVMSGRERWLKDCLLQRAALFSEAKYATDIFSAVSLFKGELTSMTLI